MSSHREAPEISKDPVADNTDIYAFVSPDRPDTVTIITNYIPLEDPAGGPNFFEFGDDVLYRINIDNDGTTASPTSRTSSSSRRGSRTRTRSSTTPGRSTRSTARTSTAADLRRARGAWSGADRRARQRPAVAAVQRRVRVDAELPGARQRGDLRPRRRHQGVRRSAPRRVLRRPRLDLRPRRAAPVPEPAPDPDARRGRRQRTARVQRPHASRSRSRSAA